MRPPRGTCKVTGCKRPHYAKGRCNTHYQRLYLSRKGRELFELLRAANGGCVTYRLIKYQMWTRFGKKPPSCDGRANNVVYDRASRIRWTTGAEITHHIGVGYSLKCEDYWP